MIAKLFRDNVIELSVVSLDEINKIDEITSAHIMFDEIFTFVIDNIVVSNENNFAEVKTPTRFDCYF